MSRTAKRAKRRLACRIVTGGQRFSGVILDLSSSGLFVQTTARPRPHDAVTVEISIPGQREPLRVEAQVARLRLVPPQLVVVAQGGVGLRIRNAPEGYFAFLTAVLPEPTAAGSAAEPDADEREDLELRPAAGAPPPAAPRRRYRVRMSQLGGARSRTLRIDARSAQQAASLAVEAAGDGWKVLETEDDESD
jgi:hypothetical protein